MESDNGELLQMENYPPDVLASARLNQGRGYYVIGGNDPGGKYYGEVLSARFDFGQP